jgi:hypothetical protein
MTQPEGSEEIDVWESKEDCIRKQKCYLDIRMIELQWFTVMAEGSPRIFVNFRVRNIIVDVWF